MNPQFDKSLPNKFSAPDYMEFVRSIGCAIDREECYGPTHAHHMVYRSSGGSDLDTIPLCEKCHAYFHRIGESAFCEEFGIEEGQIQRLLIHMYIQSLGAGDRPGVKAEKKKLRRGANLLPTAKTVNKF